MDESNKDYSRQGFTLIELILVLMLLVVLVGLTVPNFRPFYQSMALSNTVQHISDMMRFAQSQAVTQGRPVVMEIGLNPNSLQLVQKSDDSDFIPIKGRFGRKEILDEGVQITTDFQHWAFYPDGQIVKGRMKLCSGQRKCFLISTEKYVGKIEVFELEQ